MDKGLKTLFTCYWSSQGWAYTIPSVEDFEEAKQEGYMFDYIDGLSHEQTLCEIRSVLSKISPADVANAFLYSLSTRSLAHRSALGSYYYALAIPEHEQDANTHCYICDWYDPRNRAHSETPISHDANVFNRENAFNFERHKWGGVRHTQSAYALFDLQQFLLLPKVSPCEADFQILKNILSAMNELPATKKVGALRDLIVKKKLFKSHKAEIEVLLNILGICGVLSSKNAPCYCERFVSDWGRTPLEAKSDFAYPVNRWHVSDGVNQERFLKVFGKEYQNL